VLHLGSGEMQEVAMFGVGFSELLVIAVVCLIVYGPDQLPSLMRKCAQFYRQFSGLREELRFQILSVDEQPPKNEKKKVLDAGDEHHG
jgi:sec-independent protein translocase protein TatB